VEGFLEVVESAWVAGPTIANYLKCMSDKLVATSKALTRRNDRFISINKKHIMLDNELILRLDVATESRALSPEERSFRKLFKRKLLGLASFKQRSRIMWLAEEDG
jgi:hypothetical protein